VSGESNPSGDQPGDILARQRAAFVAARPEPLSTRRDRLERLKGLLADNGEALAAAMSDDFGQRSRDMSMMSDVVTGVSLVNYCLARLTRWARPEKRRPNFPLALFGARAEVRYEPKGVIGIVSRWNFPVGLTFSPLAQALAAGNRAMIKPSEFTERTSATIAELVGRYFAADEVAVVTGGADVGRVFCALPFDHLLFTGATSVGRQVMRAAAENLVPVTLELGGKSPAIIAPSADVERAAGRIALGKMMNAGQICLAPDYVLVDEALEQRTVAALVGHARQMYPSVLGNDDYASVINARHRERLTGLIADAVGKGAEAIEVNPAGEDFAAGNANKLPLTILRNVDDGMKVMQEEIFGPVLPVKTYRGIDAAIAYVNAHDHPLGLYFFGEDKAEEERVVSRTASGGVTVNDVMYHVSMDDLPFGGIGPSGMGSYHGPEGFRTFSHARAVYRQPAFDLTRLIGVRPPYGKAIRRTIALGLKL
jgi:coniferyl-aldehyde dehydrogenase